MIITFSISMEKNRIYTHMILERVITFMGEDLRLLHHLPDIEF